MESDARVPAPGEDTSSYKVVVNGEEQYSLWPADRPNPPGWNDAGMSGAKADCLAYIKEVWTDMRPLSLRKRMGAPRHNRPIAEEGRPRRLDAERWR